MPVVKRGDMPHVWHTTDPDGGDCRHLAMCEDGAIQAHLLHHGMLSMDGIITEDLGRISNEHSDRNDICFDKHCVLYGLSFPLLKEYTNASSQQD